MASNPTRRIPPTQLQADRDAFDALTAIPNYAPANPAYSVAAITAKRQAMTDKQAAETQAAAAAAAARDDATSSEWDYHNDMLGAKDQVGAQFGKDSNEYQSLGLKKKSEYAKNTQRKSRQGSASK
jgi:hypothetical protein